MDLQGKLLKFKDNKIRGSLESAQYTLTYRQTHDPDESARISYAILSALMAEDLILLELNSSLLYTSEKPKDELIYQCVDTVKNLGLEYRYRKVPPAGAPSFFEKLFKGARGDAHQLIVQIPPESWKNESILSLILPCGARYYITGSPSGDANLLDAFANMTDRDKLGHFRLIVFDMSVLGHMGINSASLEPGEVKSLLKI